MIWFADTSGLRIVASGGASAQCFAFASMERFCKRWNGFLFVPVKQGLKRQNAQASKRKRARSGAEPVSADNTTRAYAKFRVDKIGQRISDSWKSPIPITTFLSHHPAVCPDCHGYFKHEHFRTGGKIPKERICPACKRHVPQFKRWRTRKAGYLPVCLQCWRNGVRISAVSHAQQAIARPETKLQRKARIRQELIERFNGSPPVCWNCKQGSTRFIVRPGYVPTCNKCWRNGVKMILDNLPELES